MLEVAGEIAERDTEHVSALLNQRLAGLTCSKSGVVRRQDARAWYRTTKCGLNPALHRFGRPAVCRRESEKPAHLRTTYIIEQPEFVDPKNFRGVIE